MPRSPRSTAPFAGRRVRAAVAGAIGRTGLELITVLDKAALTDTTVRAEVSA